MLFARLKNITRRTWLIAGLVLLVALAGSAWLLLPRPAKGSAYQTELVQRGNLTASVDATGAVRAAQSATLVWNTAGRVETVNAVIGDQVSADKVLASLAPGSVSRGIILAQADLISARQNLDNLQNSDNSLAQAMKNLSDANQAVKDAQDKYDSLTRKRVSQQLIDDTTDNLKKAEDQLKRLEYIFDRFYAHMTPNNANRLRMVVNLTNARQNVANLKAQLNWYTSKASDNDVAIALAALNLAKARQEDAQREMDRQKNGKNADDLAAAEARVAAAQATYELSTLKAPFNGVITRPGPQPGDRVSAGDVAFQVDDLSHLMVDLQISEVDINNVSLQQPVTITFDAVPNKVYNGVVSQMDLSAKGGQGGVNFAVVVTLTDPDEQVKPGMSASVAITVRQVNNTLIVPNRALRMVDGQRVVYVLKDGEPTPVVIRLGASADSNSQVVGGNLKEGDLLVLNPPVTTQGTIATPAP